MKLKFGQTIVKFRVPILIIAIILLIPAAYGYLHTRINYDILSYLPDDIETMKGQDILVDEFGTGAFSFVIVNDMDDKDVATMKAKIENVDHVSKAIWYDSFMDLSVPKEMLPTDVYNAFNTEDTTLIAVIFDETSSTEHTMEAINQIKDITKDQALVSGMSAVVTEIKEMSDKETPVYVLIAVLCSLAVLFLTMESFLAPVLFLVSIGFAIVYNLGTNVFMGEISYITKALAAVLQLGVTMDYSIFLWHSYKEEQQICDGDNKKAMAQAIANTITSVTGSSITTIAGFIALCFMSFTLGLDLGVVMAKGVLFGVIGCVTLLPSLLLVFDHALVHTRHKKLLPSLERPMRFVNKHYIIIAVIFLVILFPAIYGKTHTSVYYDLSESLPTDLQCIQANDSLRENYDMNSVNMILLDKDTSTKDVQAMTTELQNVKGITTILSLDSIIGPTIPEETLPDSIKEIFESNKYKLVFALSDYKVATDEANAQVTTVKNIIKSYDKNAMLVGEAPGTKDLIDITDHDFQVVSIISILAVFVIIGLVFKSISLPIVLVAVIEFAIFVNMGIPYYTGTSLPFIASIIIGTIQLGSTVDYAILMTTRYQKERNNGVPKKEAVSIAHVASTESILVSAFSFFAATFGVGLYSEIDMISSLCILMARGAMISMVTVLLVLPSVLIICDPIIVRTSFGFKGARQAQLETPTK